MKTEDVAEYFEVSPELLPYIPELLADLWALGSSPETVVEWVRSLELPPETTGVLDLGCGKGAVSIALAKEFNFRIFGIDFFEPFIVDARKRAKESGVHDLCSFECADMHDILKKARDFNIVIYTAVGGVLGSFDQCVFQLRQAIKSGDYMIIDDGFRLTSNEISFSGYDHYVSYEETIHQLTSHGDTILQEKVVPVEHIKIKHQRNTELITKRVENLAREHPELTDSFPIFWSEKSKSVKYWSKMLPGQCGCFKRLPHTDNSQGGLRKIHDQRDVSG